MMTPIQGPPKPPIAAPNYSAPLISMAGMPGQAQANQIPRLANGQIDQLALAQAAAPQNQSQPLFHNGSWGQPAQQQGAPAQGTPPQQIPPIGPR